MQNTNDLNNPPWEYKLFCALVLTFFFIGPIIMLLYVYVFETKRSKAWRERNSRYLV